jgi:hypothetical protein
MALYDYLGAYEAYVGLPGGAQILVEPGQTVEFDYDAEGLLWHLNTAPTASADQTVSVPAVEVPADAVVAPEELVTLKVPAIDEHTVEAAIIAAVEPVVEAAAKAATTAAVQEAVIPETPTA